MKQLIGVILAIALLIFGMTNAMAIEEAKYDVVQKDDKFEIRDYAPHVLAETLVESNFEKAGSKAFKRLLRYISGSNESRAEMAMTAPISQQRSQEGWAVSFMMPASSTLETLPIPTEEWVTLREVPARRVAAVSYSGTWSEEAYLQNKSKLESWILNNNLAIVGEPIWARYNPPFIPWFLRRNEILIPVNTNSNE